MSDEGGPKLITEGPLKGERIYSAVLVAHPRCKELHPELGKIADFTCWRSPGHEGKHVTHRFETTPGGGFVIRNYEWETVTL